CVRHPGVPQPCPVLAAELLQRLWIGGAGTLGRVAEEPGEPADHRSSAWRPGKPLGARATANHMANGGLAGAGGLALCADSAGNQPVALPPATEPQLADADSDKAGNLPAAGVVVQRLVA